jgi:oligoendopeptidase F
MKYENTTLSEQFRNQIEKSDRDQMYTYVTAHFPGFVQALE